MMIEISDLRAEFDDAVAAAALMLRRVRKTPDDQDIDRNEALKLVNDGFERQAFFDEIERMTTENSLLMDVYEAAVGHRNDYGAGALDNAIQAYEAASGRREP